MTELLNAQGYLKIDVYIFFIVFYHLTLKRQDDQDLSNSTTVLQRPRSCIVKCLKLMSHVD